MLVIDEWQQGFAVALGNEVVIDSGASKAVQPKRSDTLIDGAGRFDGDDPFALPVARLINAAGQKG